MMNPPRVNHRVVLVATLAAWIALAAGLAQVYGPGLFFLVLAGGGLLLAIFAFWKSVLGLSQDSPLALEEALGMAAPTSEEERKQSVLRILKDLEYERAVGKIADADFRELSERYRAEARALLSNVEEGLGPARRRAENDLKERLEASGIAGATPTEAEAPLAAETNPADESPLESPVANSEPAPSTTGEAAGAKADSSRGTESEPLQASGDASVRPRGDEKAPTHPTAPDREDP
jgi:hypothetical protein